MALKVIKEKEAAEAPVSPPLIKGPAQGSNVAGGMLPQENIARAGGLPPSEGADGPLLRMTALVKEVAARPHGSQRTGRKAGKEGLLGMDEGRSWNPSTIGRLLCTWARIRRSS